MRIPRPVAGKGDGAKQSAVYVADPNRETAADAADTISFRSAARSPRRLRARPVSCVRCGPRNTLVEMAARGPTTSKELEGIRGMGPVKIARYGEGSWGSFAVLTES